jgi:hypothetical protein
MYPKLLSYSPNISPHNAARHRQIRTRAGFLPRIIGDTYTRSGFKTVGDCPNFAQSAEQNGTVPFSETVLKLLLGTVISGPNRQKRLNNP